MGIRKTLTKNENDSKCLGLGNFEDGGDFKYLAFQLWRLILIE